MARARREFRRECGIERLPADAPNCARAAAMRQEQDDGPRALVAAQRASALDPGNQLALKVEADATR